MNATTWLIIAIVGFSLSGITLIAAIFIFIKLDIPAVMGELSGKTAAREIQAIRAASESEKTEKTEDTKENNIKKSAMALAHLSKRLDKAADMDTTEKMNDADKERHTKALKSERYTEPLVKQHKTSILSRNNEVRAHATVALRETEKLKEREIIPVKFKITRSIVVIHTNEVIE